MTKTLHWYDFSPEDTTFHVAGLSSNKKQGTGEHTHEGFAECFLVVSGHLRHQINKQEQLLRAGQFVMIRETDTHDFRPVRGESFTFRNVAFRTDVLTFVRNRYFQDRPDFWGGSEPLPATRTLTNKPLERMEYRFAHLMTQPRKRIAIESFLLDLLTDTPSQNPHSTTPIPDWLECACEAMRDPAQFAEGTPALFRRAGRSPEHVSRELKRCTGETPTEFINRLRLEHAARRLMLSGKDIATIAYDCGFETLSYFSALFKKQLGVTPRDYRKKHRAAVFGGAS